MRWRAATALPMGRPSTPLSDKASDAEAQRLADAENRADIIAGVNLADEPDDIADILIDLAQRETKTFSSAFARSVVNEFKNAARLHKNPLRSAGFRVLKAPDVPSVLIELGYVSNRGRPQAARLGPMAVAHERGRHPGGPHLFHHPIRRRCAGPPAMTPAARHSARHVDAIDAGCRSTWTKFDHKTGRRNA